MENYRNIVMSLILFLMGSLTAMAQNETLSGRVVEKGSGKAMDHATVQLYKLSTSRSKTDTTYVGGTLSDAQGRFVFRSVNFGSYLVKVSFLGYREQTLMVSKVKGRQASLHDIAMRLQQQ